MTGSLSNNSMALQAKRASIILANIDTDTKNRLLLKISENIKLNREKIATENRLDVNIARELLEKGELSKPLLNRLILNDEKINQLSTYLEEVAKLEDPVGKKQFAMKLADELELERVTCPIGVIAIIFESRPATIPALFTMIPPPNIAVPTGGEISINPKRATSKVTINRDPC
ncbi:gamma-glutamyl-phosphate reductase, partial [bacterium]|nr:gamma-glutamyl-phosphate reductase [bacterium]